ncbi:MAG TPA: DUF4062 domain-containing protein [Allosphingosinicella sp.]|nr:DUF4062 domain-containing protein [Allosphingosinicella sp.]
MADRAAIARVFISSTLQEFQEERDLLVRRVFPEMRRRLSTRGVDLVEVDLRWGITAEQEARGEVIPICLEEIARCAYFVGLLGDHYSAATWEAKPRLLARYPRLAACTAASVTEIEMLRAALDDSPLIAERSLFYFRAPTGRASPPGTAGRLAALKQRIRDSGLPLVENLATAEALVARLRADLEALIEADFPEAAFADPVARETAEHEAVALALADGHVGAEAALAALDKWGRKARSLPLLVTGAPGSGKSALLARWSRDRAERSAQPLFSHHVGAGPESDRPGDILRRLVGWLRLQGAAVEVEGAATAAAFAACFAAAAALAGASGRPILLVLDALDRLAEGQDLLWLPTALPEGLVLLASAKGDSADFSAAPFDRIGGRTRTEMVASPAPELDAGLGAVLGSDFDPNPVFSDARSDDPVTDVWRRRQWKDITLDAIERPARRRLLGEAAARFSKSFAPAHLERILGHPMAGNPLFLHTLLDELRLSADFDRFGAYLTHYLEAGDLAALVDRVLARLETDCGRDLVANAFRLLWASRAGIEESELAAMVGVTPIQWSAFLIEAESLIRRGRRLTLASETARAAVGARYCQDEDLVAGVRLALARRLDGADAARRAEEVPWQLARAGAWDRLEAVLVDPGRFRALLARGETELLGHWRALAAFGRDPAPLLAEAWHGHGGADLGLGQAIAGFLRFADPASTAVGDFQTMLLEALRARLGPDDQAALAAERAVAELQLARGRTGEAALSLCGLLARQQARLGVHHDDSVATALALARALIAAGREAEAEPLLKASVARLRLRGPAFVETLSAALRALADCALARGDRAGAAILRAEALDRLAAMFGAGHPATLDARADRIESLCDRGDLIEASYEARAVLEARERLLGLRHPSTLSAAALLARALARIDDHSAPNLLRYVVDHLEEALGGAHPATRAAAARVIDRARRDPILTDPETARSLSYAPSFGMMFDIDGLAAMEYGRAAYRLLFDAIPPPLLCGSRWFDGDSRATLGGGARSYLVALELARPQAAPAIRQAVAAIEHPALPAGAARFVEAARLRTEPLVPALRIGPLGVPDWSAGPAFPLAAWCAARDAREGGAPGSTQSSDP